VNDLSYEVKRVKLCIRANHPSVVSVHEATRSISTPPVWDARPSQAIKFVGTYMYIYILCIVFFSPRTHFNELGAGPKPLRLLYPESSMLTILDLCTFTVMLVTANKFLRMHFFIFSSSAIDFA